MGETDKQTTRKRGKGAGETEDRKREEWNAFRFSTQSFLSLKIRSPALRTMVFDVAKLASMLRDALDEVSGLEMMLVTARARVRRNETPFS